MANTFPKQNKLCGQKRIATLYKEGKRFTAWPLRVTWMPTDEETKILVWAPKSLFKHAVRRNRLRRLIREAYRLNQHIPASGNDNTPSEAMTQGGWFIAFNYIDKEEQPFAVIEKAVCKALKKVKGEK